MKIYFKTRKLQKLCSEESIMRKRLGENMAGRLQQRMMELKAAESLADVSRLGTARCHELKGNRAGQLSVDLEHPYRLLFMPAIDPVPRKKDGGMDWEQVTEIEIIGIEDTH